MLTFRELYEAHAPEVYKFAYWLAGDASEAEDIVSETFIRAWVKRQTIRTETLNAYLFKIARNYFLGQHRKQKPLTTLETDLPDPAPQPQRLVEARQELMIVKDLLQTLPEIDRTAFVLRVQHDLPYAEIARVLCISLAAAKVKIHRVRKKLIAETLDKEV